MNYVFSYIILFENHIFLYKSSFLFIFKVLIDLLSFEVKKVGKILYTSRNGLFYFLMIINIM